MKFVEQDDIDCYVFPDFKSDKGKCVCTEELGCRFRKFDKPGTSKLRWSVERVFPLENMKKKKADYCYANPEHENTNGRCNCEAGSDGI